MTLSYHCDTVSLFICKQLKFYYSILSFNVSCTGSSCSLHQYHLVNKNKTWYEAQKYCRQNYTDLATINNMDEMERLLNTVNGIYPGLAWIGLYDDLNSWKWSLDDNSFYKKGERRFRKWYISKPRWNWNEDSLCVYISGYDGVWWGSSCSWTLPFICFDGEHSNYVCVK